VVLLESVSFFKVRISILTQRGRLMGKCIGMLSYSKMYGLKTNFVGINLKLNYHRVAHKKLKLLESVSYFNNRPVHANHGLSFSQLGVKFSNNDISVMALGIETGMPPFDSPYLFTRTINRFVSFVSLDCYEKITLLNPSVKNRDFCTHLTLVKM